MKKIILVCFVALLLISQATNEAVKADSPGGTDAQTRLFSSQTVIEQAQVPAKAAVPGSAPASGNALTMLREDSGKNLSEMNFTLYSAVADFGSAGQSVGEVVKFKAPRAGWNLKALQIVGWSGFNNTTKRFPPDRNFLIEVRDKDANLLYKFADMQNCYFASTTGPVAYLMDIPPLAVTEDFYVVFYDRGSMYLGVEVGNGSGNSYFVIKGELLPAEFGINEKNETMKVNWLIRAIGE